MELYKKKDDAMEYGYCKTEKNYNLWYSTRSRIDYEDKNM